MTPVRTGVLGVGRLGREHARILGGLEGSLLAGVHDVDRDRVRSVARDVGTRAFDDADPLLSRADAVVIAVPTPDHHAVVARALRAGCHVLVEKPFTETLEEADELIGIAEAEGLELRVGHVERFNGAVRGGLPHLDRPRFIESLRLAPFQPRGTDVTVVLDLMIHDIDLVLGLVDSPLESLHAVGTPVLTPHVDIANARLVFEDGTVAEITASRVSEERTRVVRLFQPSGYLRLDLAAGRGEFLRRREGSAVATGEAASLDEFVERVPLESDDREPLALELEDFLRAVRGEDSRVVSAREGRAALEIALRISHQIDRHGHVALETA